MTILYHFVNGAGDRHQGFGRSRRWESCQVHIARRRPRNRDQSKTSSPLLNSGPSIWYLSARKNGLGYRLRQVGTRRGIPLKAFLSRVSSLELSPSSAGVEMRNINNVIVLDGRYRCTTAADASGRGYDTTGSHVRP